MNNSRKERFRRAFGWFDTNGDQFFTREDLIGPWHGFALAMGITVDSDEYQATIASINEMFNSIVEVADKDSDGRISLEEFYGWGDALADPASAAREAYDKLIWFATGMQDLNKDGSIHRDEYALVLGQYGKDGDTARRAWNIFAEGKESLSREAYCQVAPLAIRADMR
ncbi:MAG: EF-hand domain-containing protein [Chloroflexota bacterium]